MLAHGLVDHGLFLVDLSYAFFFALGAVQHLVALTHRTAAPVSRPAQTIPSPAAAP
jgi:hypothetical protein